ncbi:hypothetical protein, partial [Oleiagrimonas sp. MCCC 1A03011]|uniref:hypothetical protein n=1 Tax=Oleiagrimonas sp. MCCC 1A03011 TaxID=1926883 RepID=UPI00143CD613
NASTPKGARHNKDNSNIDRLENLLDKWAGYKSPYPEIRDAFLYFKNGGAKERVSTNKVTDENIPAEMLPEDIDGYVRIISYVKRTGGVLTVEISRDADETMSA